MVCRAPVTMAPASGARSTRTCTMPSGPVCQQAFRLLCWRAARRLPSRSRSASAFHTRTVAANSSTRWVEAASSNNGSVADGHVTHEYLHVTGGDHPTGQSGADSRRVDQGVGHRHDYASVTPRHARGTHQLGGALSSPQPTRAAGDRFGATCRNGPLGRPRATNHPSRKPVGIAAQSRPTNDAETSEANPAGDSRPAISSTPIPPTTPAISSTPTPPTKPAISATPTPPTGTPPAIHAPIIATGCDSHRNHPTSNHTVRHGPILHNPCDSSRTPRLDPAAGPALLSPAPCPSSSQASGSSRTHSGRACARCGGSPPGPDRRRGRGRPRRP